MNDLYFILQYTLYSAIPLLIVALGAMYSERSGVINIAMEGLMLVGAFVGTVILRLLQESGLGDTNILYGQLYFIIAILVAGIVGAVCSLLHAFASINMRADQTISGTALNILFPAIAVFLARTMSLTNYTQEVSFRGSQVFLNKVKFLGDIPVIGDIFFKKAYISTYIGFIILIIAYILLYHTRFGLRLRACGEHPQAADAAGIKVSRVRYAGVIISGFLAGAGGLIFIVTTSTSFNATVSGYGFLAIAVLIFGNWRPIRILFSALFFGFMNTVSSAYSLIPILKEFKIPSEFFRSIPYLATLILLAFTSKKSRGPRALGEIYDPGKR